MTEKQVVNVAAYAGLHNYSTRMVRKMLGQGRIPGATKPGRDWIIPADAPWPPLRKRGRKAKEKPPV